MTMRAPSSPARNRGRFQDTFTTLAALFLLSLFLLSTLAGAQVHWDEELKLSMGSSAKGFSDSEVNSRGETVTIWMESNGGNIQLKGTVVTRDARYLVFGRTVAATGGSTYFPDIAIDGEDNVHLVWLEWRENQHFFVYMKMDRFLVPLTGQKILNINPGVQQPPSLANAPKLVYDGVDSLHVTWADQHRARVTGSGTPDPDESIPGHNEVFYIRLDLAGESTTQVTRISDSPDDSIFPDIAVNPYNHNQTMIVWSNNETGDYEIYFSVTEVRGYVVNFKVKQLSFSASTMDLAPSVDYGGNGLIYVAWSERPKNSENFDSEHHRFRLKLAQITPGGKVQQTRTLQQGAAHNGQMEDDGTLEEDALFPELEVGQDNHIYLFWNSNRESSSNQLRDIILGSILANVTTLNYYFEYAAFGHEFFEQEPVDPDQGEDDGSWRSFVQYIVPILEMGTNLEEWDGYYMELDGSLHILEEAKKVSCYAGKSFFPSPALDSANVLHLSFQNGDDHQLYFKRAQEESREEDGFIYDSDEVFPVVAGVAVLGFLAYVSVSRSKEFIWANRRFIFFGVPLYTTISKKNVLKNKKRQEICHILISRKGLTFSELMRDLNMKNGVLAYHLTLLEKNKLVKSARDGKFRRFFLYEDAMPSYTSLECKIVETVTQNPRISHDQLAKSIHVSRIKLNKKIEELVHEGVLIPKYGNSSVHYFTNENQQ